MCEEISGEYAGIREIFEAEFATAGGEVKVTQASRDRGVDAIAFDPDPICGNAGRESGGELASLSREIVHGSGSTEERVK